MKKEIRILNRIRTFLKPLWAEYHQERGITPTTDDCSMCRYTAAFMAEILGGKWKVAGGADLQEVNNPHIEPGGFLTPSGERFGHYWATNGTLIIDLAAEQFGADAVIVTGNDDPRYISNYTAEELAEHLNHVEEKVDEWLEGFYSECEQIKGIEQITRLFKFNKDKGEGLNV